MMLLLLFSLRNTRTRAWNDAEYAAPSRLPLIVIARESGQSSNRERLVRPSRHGVLDRPVKPGDDTEVGLRARPGMTQSAFCYAAFILMLVLLPTLGATTVQVRAQTPTPSPPPVFSPGKTFTEQGGEALYTRICQGCHMADGRGATGAGSYPALAGNANLATAAYPLTVVLNGLRGMPPIGAMMSDSQVADVVNYVRGHFGNAYTDGALSAADVKAARNQINNSRRDDGHEPQTHAGARRAPHRYRPCCIVWEPPR